MTSDDATAKVVICRGGGDPEYNALLEKLNLGAEFREGRLVVVAEKKTTSGSAAATATASKPSGKK
jgi:hypothetical protein